MEKLRKPFKVSLVGSCGVGKTSVLEGLQAQLPSDIVFIEEAARVYFQAKNTSSSHDFKDQWAIQTMVIIQERKAGQQNPKGIVCDRSVMDCIVYSRVNGDLKGAEILLGRARFWIPDYSKIFLLDPKGVPYKTDEIRIETPERRQQLHQGFLDFFAENKVPFELLGGSLEERISRVKQSFNKTT